MNGGLDHHSLQHLADEDLARRAQTSGLVYIALCTIIIIFTRYAHDHRTIAVLAGLTILVAATLRTWMILKFNSFNALSCVMAAEYGRKGLRVRGACFYFSLR